jgi:HPt (histidine-containing phosphotransfer) domain-containing protein
MPDTPSNQDLDLAFLYEIADGSNEFIIESIDMLLQQTPELLQTIGDAINVQDWPIAAGAAHKLKPSMGFFGMLICQELLQEIELQCKAGGNQPEQISAKYSDACDLINKNLVTLTQLKAEKETEL